MAKSGNAIPYAVLPLAMNFARAYIDSHKPGSYIRSRFLPHAITPLLVHYHHNRTAHGLRRSGHGESDPVTADINATLFLPSGRARAGGIADAQPKPRLTTDGWGAPPAEAECAASSPSGIARIGSREGVDAAARRSTCR